jgi:hypothetical protein
MVLRPATANSCEAKPTKLKTNMSVSFGTFMVKLPSLLVVTPFVVPFTVTLTPGRGWPVSSITFPVIGPAAKHICRKAVMKKATNNVSRFMILLVLS